MAEVSYPSPAYNSRNVTDAEYERISARDSDSGVFIEHVDSGGFVVVAGTGLQVLIKAGNVGNVRGFAWEAGTTDVPLTVSANASSSTRLDWVVLRLNRSTWTVRAAIVEGTPGAGTPALSGDLGTTGLYEIPLAFVTVLPSAASVTVTAYTQFVGTRIRPRGSNVTGLSATGEIGFELDTGRWVGFDGTTSHTIHSDSGDIPLSGGFDTWEQRDACYGRRLGDQASLRLSYRRVKSAFPSSDATGSKLCVLPPTLTPRFYQYFDVSFGNGAVALVRVQADGEVWVEAPSKDVDVNRVMRQTMTYFI